HVNTAGVHIPLYMVSQGVLGGTYGTGLPGAPDAGVVNPPSVGWGLNADYPNQEGSFFGNLFILGGHGYDSTSVAAFYCDGKAYDVATVPGRIGANQVGAPYKNPYIAGPYASGVTGYCSDVCTAMDYPYGDSGYKACSGWNNVVTTYRQPAAGGTVA